MTLFPVKTPESDFIKLSKLVYGLPKTGKTTLASLFVDADGRKPAFIATEDGHGALTVHAIRVTSWLGFLKLVQDIKASVDQIKHAHSCFVIDLVSDLDEMAAKYICEKNHIASLGDLEHGKGWFMHKAAFRSAINDLLGVLPCVFICHTEVREDPKTKLLRMDPSLGKQCREFVNGKVDILMWLQPAEGNALPQVVIKPSTTVNSGSRFPQLNRAFTYDPRAPHKTVEEMSKVFAERLSESNPVPKE